MCLLEGVGERGPVSSGLHSALRGAVQARASSTAARNDVAIKQTRGTFPGQRSAARYNQAIKAANKPVGRFEGNDNPAASALGKRAAGASKGQSARKTLKGKNARVGGQPQRDAATLSRYFALEIRD